MKFLIVGDLHGAKPKIMCKDFDAVIAPGDFCSDKTRKFMFQALQKRLKDPESKITWQELIGKERAEKEIAKSISDGRKILEFLNSFEKPVYIVPGNWDWVKEKGSFWSFFKKDHYKGMIKGLGNVVDVYHKIKSVNGYQIIGHGVSSGPEYPQYKEDLKRFTEKELIKMKKDYLKLESKVGKLFTEAKKPIIFLSHNVPYNTKLDKITNKSSPRYGYHYGSVIARKMIVRYKPLVCIGGHMHEHFGKDRLGRTVIINAGYGPRVNTLLEIEGRKVKKLEFIRKK